MIYELLQAGRDQAISQRELLEITGLPDERALRRQVEKERSGGVLILSASAPPAGYYLPSSRAEVLEFVRRRLAVIARKRELLNAAERYLVEIDGQQCLFGTEQGGDDGP